MVSSSLLEQAPLARDISAKTSGVFFIAPDIKGDAHWGGSSLLPFTVGDINPEGSFIHVLDDATLDIAMLELDTIVDFTSYLTKKEQLIRSGHLIAAAGEEELIAYYMTHLNQKGEHDFTKPDGSDLAPNEQIFIDIGFYKDMLRNKQYHAKKAADHASYVWDRLIETFTTHMLAGTTILPDGAPFDFANL